MSAHEIKWQGIDYDVDQPLGWIIVCQCGERFTHCAPEAACEAHAEHAADSAHRCERTTRDDTAGELRCQLLAGHRGTHRARWDGAGSWGREVTWGTNDEYADGWRAALERRA